ncbi:MAG TPA: hypothetical protein VKT77_16445 [Chthonomonadaceae bacterium]|nr:hypothetical protein [Chthonomonadaceae bacterium]
MRLIITLFAFAITLLAVLPSSPKPARRDGAYVPFEGEKSSWHDGFDRFDFRMDVATMEVTAFKPPEGERFGIGAPPEGSRRCVVVCPKRPAPGNPWIWRGCYWDHQPQTEVELLRRGFHVAYISADAALKPDKYWDAWYAYLTEKHGLSRKPAFIGMSRGGEYAFTWATLHPTQVSAIYADNPGGNDDAMRRLPDLARADVPILLVCGTIDPLLGRFAAVIEHTVQDYGGRVSVILKEGAGHHPHSLRDPTPMADFIEHSFQEQPAAVPDYVAGNRFTRAAYYGLDEYESIAVDGYYVVRRGPAFVPCYNRYEVVMGLENPVTIIAPKSEAPGRPWVLRAGFVGRDAAVDQALLAKGYHIVVGPVGYNADGPNHADWVRLYKHLCDHGFAKKAVMEGAGGGAGAVYAWAIENPDKVACIYAENPILRTGGVKVQPLDDLEPLASAGIPLLHVCGAKDPALDEQTRVAEKRYNELGGRITVLLRPGEGRQLASGRNVQPAIEFVLAHP